MNSKKYEAANTCICQKLPKGRLHVVILRRIEWQYTIVDALPVDVAELGQCIIEKSGIEILDTVTNNLTCIKR